MDAVLEDWKTADIPERTRAALGLLEYMTLRPLDIDFPFMKGLWEARLAGPAIREAANVGSHYNFINRVADAFAFPIPDGAQKARLATMLNIAGKMMKGSYAESVWVRGTDGRIRPTEVDVGREHILTADGVTEPALRRAVEAFVMAKWGVHRQEETLLPDVLKPYLEKLALHAYRIVDDDMDDLRDAGYRDEAIYEITIVGAFGAALVGLEMVFEAMYGESGDIPDTAENGPPP
jgi:hypothetical protein